MSKPSILLIPGSFALPEFYDPIIDAVAAKGYSIRGLHLPSVGLSALKGREGAPPTMYDDAAFIANEAKKLADEGKDVVLIGHSYGGIPVTQSLKGVGKEERGKQGKKGGVVRLAYITSLVPAVGVAALGVLADVPKEQQLDLKVDVRSCPHSPSLSPPLHSPPRFLSILTNASIYKENGWMYHDPPAATAVITLNHLSSEEGTAWIKKFPKHSAVSFSNELTYPGYKDVPVSYLFCEEDLCIPPQIQRAGIEMMERESGRKVNVTSIRSDHCPNLTAAQDTIDWILDVAGRS